MILVSHYCLATVGYSSVAKQTNKRIYCLVMKTHLPRLLSSKFYNHLIPKTN